MGKLFIIFYCCLHFANAQPFTLSGAGIVPAALRSTFTTNPRYVSSVPHIFPAEFTEVPGFGHHLLRRLPNLPPYLHSQDFPRGLQNSVRITGFRDVSREDLNVLEQLLFHLNLPPRFIFVTSEGVFVYLRNTFDRNTLLSWNQHISMRRGPSSNTRTFYFDDNLLVPVHNHLVLGFEDVGHQIAPPSLSSNPLQIVAEYRLQIWPSTDTSAVIRLLQTNFSSAFFTLEIRSDRRYIGVTFYNQGFADLFEHSVAPSLILTQIVRAPINYSTVFRYDR